MGTIIRDGGSKKNLKLNKIKTTIGRLVNNKRIIGHWYNNREYKQQEENTNIIPSNTNPKRSTEITTNKKQQ